jgi:2-polyprenyl-3-methyl-5-hydroxy-6-metoxy-1,4-benzoquinol methylase
MPWGEQLLVFLRARLMPSSDRSIPHHHPDIEVHQGSANDDLRGRFGTFPVVMSLEVVEHIYDPRTYASTLFNLVEPGGLVIVFNAIQRLSKKSGGRLVQQIRLAPRSTVGSRAHQILVGGDADQAT